MEGSNEHSEKKFSPVEREIALEAKLALDEKHETQHSTAATDQKIQFAPAVRPVQDDVSTLVPTQRRLLSVASIPRRPQSTTSLPPALSQKEKKRREREKDEEEKHVNVDEHLMSHADVASRYHTHINMEEPGQSLGLASSQATQLLHEHGLNVLTPPRKKHPLMKFLEYLTSLFNLLLIFAGILEYILLGIDFKDNFENTYLGAILIAVAFINAFIEFYQQYKSQALLESFLNMIPAKCMCLRDGKLAKIEASSLVPGDIVYVRMGDKNPADILLFSASDCKVDNSSLTGESEPQERTKDNYMSNPMEATNIMFNSTLLISGEAYGIVIRTGDSTVIGEIAFLTAGETKKMSPLAHEINNFVKIIATIAMLTALIFFGIAFPVNNNNASLAINFAIGIFVAWVPEGLPATVTMLLTIAAKRMAAQNVLVKDLQGVETLGAITLLATDKTGTLTRNQMTVAGIWTCGGLYEASVHADAEKSVAEVDKPGVRDLLHICALCSRAKFDRTDIPLKYREVLGDATEAGLMRYAAEQLKNFDNLAGTFPKVFELPFNSDTKWHMSIHKKPHANGPLTLFIKGAPERVFALCSYVLSSPEAQPVELVAEHRQAYDETYEHMASQGHIVGVTGDGVNDAPALKKADLGIAMNNSGSDVSKEAASMILLDDNFASIIRGIEEGRLIFVNLKKSIKYTISHSTPEVIPNLLYIIVPIPLPISAILILVIDLGFELFAALSFAWDPPETEEGLMLLPPRKPVTPETAMIFRRRALRRTQSLFDEEAGVDIALDDQTKIHRLLHNIQQFASKEYWSDKFENTGAEVLVDGPLLSWAYLEIGIIEAIGALVSFFVVLQRRGISPHDARVMQRGNGPPTKYFTKNAEKYKGIDAATQVDILAEAQSMYYWAIMTMQMFNLFACKTRLTLPFGKYMFANRATFYCIFAGASLGAFIVYVPGVEVVFGTTRHLLPLYWLVPMAFGFVLIAYASVRMIIRRRARPIEWNPEVPGLQMYPTIRTFGTMSSRRSNH